MSVPRELIKGFIDTVVDTFRRRPLFAGKDPILESYGPLQGIAVLGDGGQGFVVRGFVLAPEAQGSHRVRWFVVKGPVLLQQHRGAGKPPLVVYNHGVEDELRQRKGLGKVQGLGPVPRRVDWPVSLIEPRLPRTVRVAFPLPTITLAVFEIPDALVAQEPPWDLAHFVERPVERAVDLRNWCAIARSLGSALLAMHAQGWVHGDIKLANVVAQQRGRFLRSIELIDFGLAREFDRPLGPPPEVYVGDWGTKQYWRPERLAAWDAWESARTGGTPSSVPFWWLAVSAVDEDVHAYASLLARVLLGRRSLGHPDRPRTRDIVDLVAGLSTSPSEPADPIAQAIAEAFALVHGLLTREHEESFAPVDAFLRAVEVLQIEAEDGDSPSTIRSPLARLPKLLEVGDLSGSDETPGWDRYVLTNRELALARCGYPPGEPPSIAVAVDLLRIGYVRAARALLRDLLEDDAYLDELLQRPGGLANDGEATRVLRVYVGQILLREGDAVTGRATLARFREKIGPEAPRGGLVWWIAMLTARFDFAARSEVSLGGLAQPRPDELDDRQRLWLVAFEAQRALRRRDPVSTALRERLERVARAPSVSMSERLFVDMLLARCLARAGDPVAALQCLHGAAADAARLRFPVEYASILYHAPEILLDFGDREQLEESRLELGALLKSAEDLAIRGAELLHQMRVDVARDHAIQVAGRCAVARGGPAGIVAAACWHELADANATLSERPSSVRRADLATLREPPAGAAQDRYDRAVLGKVWGPGGLRVELPGDDGAVLQGLLREHALDPPPGPVLVVGYGTGGDVFHLAAKHPSLPILGVDAYAVNFRAASDRVARRPLPPDASFCVGDIAQGEPLAGEDAGGKGPWKLLILRETLADVTLKRAFLHALRRRVPQGARLLITDVVQCAPEGPEAWRSQLQRLGVPNLTTRHALREDLAAANFAVERDALDTEHALLRFLERRQRWFEHREDVLAQALHEDPESRWVKKLFEKLVEAAQRGVLGWLRLGAVAVGGDPPPPSASNKKWSLAPPP